MKTLILGLLLFFFLSTPSARAHISLGGYFDFPGQIQVDSTGKRNTTDFDIFVAANIYIRVYDFIWFQPEIGYVFPKTSEGDTTNRKIFTNYYAAFQVAEPLFLKIGFGLFVTIIETPAQEVLLNNGDSFTTFYRPGGESRSYNSTLNLGAEYFFTEHMSARLDTYVFAIKSSDKRAFSFALGGTYHF